MTTSFNTMGIIGAMDVEIALLREEMAKAGAVKITRIAGMEFNAVSYTHLNACGRGMAAPMAAAASITITPLSGKHMTSRSAAMSGWRMTAPRCV